MKRTAWIVAGLALAAPPAPASDCPVRAPAPGHLVGVSIEIDGRTAPLHPAPDGAARWYVEARRGAPYAIRLQNRTRHRIGVELRVDGLDVISGEAPPAGGRGRLYVLSPGGSTLVRGWRSSLDTVQRFEFVDEERSYAVRAHRPGARPGWIEARVFRERPRPHVARQEPKGRSGAPETSDRASEGAARSDAPAAGRSHPGTGWGERLGDRAVVVDFDADTDAAESVSVRYEYEDALHALGVLPQCDPWRRLWERERGGSGFAQPPPRDHR